MGKTLLAQRVARGGGVCWGAARGARPRPRVEGATGVSKAQVCFLQWLLLVMSRLSEILTQLREKKKKKKKKKICKCRERSHSLQAKGTTDKGGGVRTQRPLSPTRACIFPRISLRVSISPGENPKSAGTQLLSSAGSAPACFPPSPSRSLLGSILPYRRGAGVLARAEAAPPHLPGLTLFFSYFLWFS